MYQIIDTQKNHTPVKSGFMTPAQALKWARKNLDTNSCSGWGKMRPGDRYYIKAQ
jgi:hypothetical protein